MTLKNYFLNDDTYRLCCYNCKYCEKVNIKDNHGKYTYGYCTFHDKRISNLFANTCSSHEEIKLMYCEICGHYYRTLAAHLKLTHKTTTKSYKQTYELNRTTPLKCEHVRNKTREHTPQENLERFKKVRYVKTKEDNHFGSGKRRLEGKKNIKKAMQNRKYNPNSCNFKTLSAEKEKARREKISKTLKERNKTKFTKDIKRTITERDNLGRIVKYEDTYRGY